MEDHKGQGHAQTQLRWLRTIQAISNMIQKSHPSYSHAVKGAYFHGWMLCRGNHRYFLYCDRWWVLVRTLMPVTHIFTFNADLLEGTIFYFCLLGISPQSHLSKILSHIQNQGPHPALDVDVTFCLPMSARLLWFSNFLELKSTSYWWLVYFVAHIKSANTAL